MHICPHESIFCSRVDHVHGDVKIVSKHDARVYYYIYEKIDYVHMTNVFRVITTRVKLERYQ